MWDVTASLGEPSIHLRRTCLSVFGEIGLKLLPLTVAQDRVTTLVHCFRDLCRFDIRTSKGGSF